MLCHTRSVTSDIINGCRIYSRNEASHPFPFVVPYLASHAAHFPCGTPGTFRETSLRNHTLGLEMGTRFPEIGACMSPRCRSPSPFPHRTFHLPTPIRWHTTFQSYYNRQPLPPIPRTAVEIHYPNPCLSREVATVVLRVGDTCSLCHSKQRLRLRCETALHGGITAPGQVRPLNFVFAPSHPTLNGAAEGSELRA